MKTSKSKTFQKGDDLSDAFDWFISQLETTDWQPEGTNWIGGEPCPHDPRCDLTHKYTITITKAEQS